MFSVSKVALRRALVFGSNGALGKDVVQAFSSKGWDLFKVDLADSDFNINAKDAVALQQGALMKAVGEEKFDAIVNVAGGWAGGNAADADMAANAELMVNQSVNSSVLCTYLSSQRANENALVVFPGSAAALNPTSFMLGYGLSKAAVHHLVKSVASDPSLLPKGTCVLGVLPGTLDTPGNRAGMPDADKSSWTPTPAVAERIVAWAEGTEKRPDSGALVVLKTANGQTDFVPQFDFGMTSGGSVIALKYDGGVFMASDTLLSYGSLAKVPNVPRSKILGKYVAICATGDYADFQSMSEELQQAVTSEEILDDGHEMGPSAVFSLLHRTLYSKRSNFEPCMCQFVMVGQRDGEVFCGGVTDIGTRWVDDYAAHGYGEHICVPLMRHALQQKNGKLTREEALQVMHDCLRAIFYRECRAINRFQIVEAANNKVTISEPFMLETVWEREGYAFEKTAIIR